MQLHLFVALALSCVLQTTAMTTAAGVFARQMTPPHTAGCCDLDGCFKGACPRQVTPPHTDTCCDSDGRGHAPAKCLRHTRTGAVTQMGVLRARAHELPPDCPVTAETAGTLEKNREYEMKRGVTWSYYLLTGLFV
ncbi:hypothetical protein B0H13DRAFT_2336616 [Mycena leptocephala]|nr:hypothetical protein B0H13DRAFT_2336616 [Mycena leptocephala]